jgi:hypothetical protein
VSSNISNGSGRKPARSRYSVRTDGPRGIEEIGIGTDLNAEIAFARRHHGATRQKTWVWDVHTGMTLHRIERGDAKNAEIHVTRSVEHGSLQANENTGAV